MPIYQVKKISDEGTSSPFIARFFVGIIELRDQLFLMEIPPGEQDSVRNRFDDKYKPLLEAAQAVRDAALEVKTIIGIHLDAIRTGEIVHFRPNQYDILKTIDIPLGQAVDKLIDQSIVATKACLQSILRDPLALELGFFFQADQEFNAQIEKLRTSGDGLFAKYLEDVRSKWHAGLQNLRVQHEHKGWSLEMITYYLAAPNKVEMKLPNVQGVPVDIFAISTANRVLLSIENIMVFAMQRHCSLPIYAIEIPMEQRDPSNIQRFRIAPGGLDSSPPWSIVYKEENDFV